MSWRGWTPLAVGVLGMGLVALPFRTGFTRSLGLHPVADCPAQPLSSAEVEARFLAGMAKMAEGQVGEHHRTDSLEQAIPILRQAAEHGHAEAMRALSGVYGRAGVVEMTGIDGLSSADAAAEWLRWDLLLHHRGLAVPDDRDEDAYRWLLDAQEDLPEGFCPEAIGVCWSLQMLTPWGRDWARDQAGAWRDCGDPLVGAGSG